MRLVFIACLQLVLALGKSQNLVPNPSFEDTVYCPLGPNDLAAIQNWYTPTMTSTDYYHACSPPYPMGLVSVPLNWMGYQNARTGNGYIGLVFDFGPINLNYREYFQVELLNELKRGHIYKVSFYVSLADSSCISISQIGALFTSHPDGSPGDFIINQSPQITSDNVILNDTQTWTEVMGYFISEGSEKYITLGCFKSNEDTDTTVVYQGVFAKNQAYYYIDDISVVDLSNTERPNIFTPNGDGLNDEFDLGISCSNCDFELLIYNRWGNCLLQTESFKWDGLLNGELCAEGVYYYLIRDKAKGEQIQSGFFHLTH